MSTADCARCDGPCPRVAARRALVKHLTMQNIRPVTFGDLIAAVLDDLVDAGVVHPYVAHDPHVPAPRAAPADVADAVRAERTARSWSQADLATRAEVKHQTYISQIERGMPVGPKVLAAVLAALDLTPET